MGTAMLKDFKKLNVQEKDTTKAHSMCSCNYTRSGTVHNSKGCTTDAISTSVQDVNGSGSVLD